MDVLTVICMRVDREEGTWSWLLTLHQIRTLPTRRLRAGAGGD